MENKRQQPMKKIKNQNQAVVSCRKHPKHQSPGVCPVCLRERLSQLSSSSASSSISSRSTATMAASSSCSSSSLSSLSSSSCDSPVYYHYNYRRGGSRLEGNISSLLKSSRKSTDLMKSRSMAAFVPRVGELGQEREREDGGVKRKTGFWSKLLMRPRSKKKDIQHQGLMHSRTMVERVPATATASTRVH